MKQHIFDSSNGLTYTLCGDYYLPDLQVVPMPTMGKYARLRLRYLKEHRPALYTSLLLSDKLNDHLTETENSGQTMVDTIVSRLKQESGITETLKATDQLRWVAEMDNIRASAEEAVLNDLIYQ